MPAFTYAPGGGDNQSINETLSRTPLTTGTALFVLVALYFLGGSGLKPFAFTLLIGLITETYSTIYIAAPVVLRLEDGTIHAAGDLRAGRHAGAY